MRIIFMGSPDFAVPSLNALVEAGHEVVAAYSQPPKAAGRGRSERETSVHERAEQLGIPVRTPRTLRNEEEQERFAALNADLGVVAAYGLILPEAILKAPKRGCINVHASLLPRWRGAAPVQRAILAGDEVTGVTIMQMDQGLDTGPMLLKRTLDIRDKNAGQVTEELSVLGAKALTEWLRDPIRGEPQPESGATYASKIGKAEARIEWGRSAAEVERQVRAFGPVPGAWFETQGERFKILEAAIDSERSGRAGEVLDDRLTIATANGSIRPIKIQRAGRAVMAPGELLRGYSIPKGTVLE